MTKAERARQISEHYESAVRDLVDAHARLTRSPLVLGVRFRFDDPLDVHLLEVVENFPGEDADPLFDTEFAPNERFVILGKLHLTLGSPAQLRHAVEQAKGRSAPQKTKDLIRSVRKDGRILYEARSPKARATLAKDAKTALGVK